MAAEMAKHTLSRETGAISGTWRMNPRSKTKHTGVAHMLYWALVFFIIAIIAGFFGFFGIAGAAAGIAKILFFVFLVLLVVSLLFGGWRRGPTI
jgi:uncharacterized membrane protein YtjA (UPF0391 family)